MNEVALKREVDNQNHIEPLLQPKPAISVIGLGYVGAVSTACLAGLGHQVIGVDIDPEKVSDIGAGKSPIHEHGLSDLLSAGVKSARISAQTDIPSAVQKTDITFVSVGTPTSADGGCDCKYIIAAARAIGEGIAQKSDYHLVVMRCSIPPSTTLNIMVPEIEAMSGKKMGEDFGVCFNPEFLREGTAIADFDAPPKTVIGASDEYAANMLKTVYASVDDNIIITTIEVAEMVKYVDNVWHATKVSFGNEVGRICKPLKIDSHKVMDIFVQDTKLNLSPYYLKPGFAYGGSCLPKEVRAVQHLAQGLEKDLPLINALDQTNRKQIEEAAHLVRSFGKKSIGFLGIAFKEGTDDLRESPVLELMDLLARDGYEISAFDPAIAKDTNVENQFVYVKHACPHLEDTVKALPSLLKNNPEDVVLKSDVLVVSQKNQRFQQLVVSNLNTRKIVDLVRLFPEAPAFPGYEGIGW